MSCVMSMLQLAGSGQVIAGFTRDYPEGYVYKLA